MPRSENHVEIARLIGVMLDRLGEDYSRDGLQETPKRMAKALLELTEGYTKDPADVFKTFENEPPYEGMVIVRDLPVRSLCEHHVLPFVGEAHVAYIPQDRIVGLSKLARTVDIFAHRLQVQERLTQQIADCIEEHLEPRGVAVVISAEHSCMSMRGVQAPGTRTVTSAVKGVFRDPNEQARAEFFDLLKIK